MTVQRILNAQDGGVAVSIAPDAGLDETLDRLAAENVGALVVSSDGRKVEGIVSERDIVRALQKDGPDLLRKQVRDVMTEDVITCVAADRAAGIMALLVSNHMRPIPVVKDGELVSMVSIRDLLQLRLDEVRSEADAMRNYITGSV